MVLKVFKSAVRITGGRMAMLLGTAVAITAFSACIAPLLHRHDNDEDISNDKEAGTPLNQTRIIKKPLSLYSIIMNGLRKFGLILPPDSPGDEPTNTSATLVIPRPETADASTSPLPQCNLVERPGGINNIKQSVNIHVVMSQSSQSTQTDDDYFSAAEGSGCSDNQTQMESNSGTVIANNCLSASGEEQTIQQARPTDEHLHEQQVQQQIEKQIEQQKEKQIEQQNPPRIDVLPQNLDAILPYHSPPRNPINVQVEEVRVHKIQKPIRAHPPKNFPVEVDVHRNESIQNHNIAISQAVPTNCRDDCIIGPTPTGRYQPEISHLASHNQSSSLKETSISSPDFTRVWPSTYVLPQTSATRRPDLGGSNSPLANWIRRFSSRFSSGKRKRLGDLSSSASTLPTVVRNMPAAGENRALERQVADEKSSTDYTTSEVLSSTKMRVSSLSVVNQAQPTTVARVAFEEELSRCGRELKTKTDRLIEETGAYLNAARSIRHRQLELEAFPVSRASTLPSKHTQFDSATMVSESGTDYELLPGEKKGITSRFKSLFSRHSKREKRPNLAGVRFDNSWNINFQKI